MVLYQP